MQDCTCQSSIPDDDAFPHGMWSPTSRYDHAKTKNKKQKRIHRSFKPCIKNFCKKDQSVRDEQQQQQQQCTGRFKKKKLPWHTVWISSCMIQLEKETLSIEIALSCASCTWCSSLLWQQRRSWSSLRESDFVPLHRNAVHFRCWFVKSCSDMHKSCWISLWAVGVHGGKVRGRESHQSASCWMASGASGQYFILFLLMLFALQFCTVENATVCTHVSRICLWKLVWKLEFDDANCAASLCTTVYGFQIRRKVLQWNMMFCKCFFFS